MASIADLIEQALQHHRQGDLSEAETFYRHILDSDPTHPDANYLLGLLKHQAGQSAAAIPFARQAVLLNPNNPYAHLNLGVANKACGQFADAAQSYRQALELKPDLVEAWYNLGNVLRDMGNLLEAIDYYRQAGKLNPQFVDAFSNLGVALRDQGRAAEAVDCYRHALRVRPDHFISHYNLGVALMDLGRLEEAATSFRQALLGNPNHADAYNNLGIVLKDLGYLEEAAASCRQAIQLDARNVNAHTTLGITLTELAKMDEAAACFRRTLKLQPDNVSARFCLCLIRLSKGDFLPAWPDYEARWQLPGAVKCHTDKPRWDGESLRGKTILLHAEQGFGDTIHFIRYAPLVKERGGTVLVECQPHLVGLLGRMAGFDHVFADNASPPPFDVQAPLMSLPGTFRTTMDTIPADIPYLSADPNLVAHWREQVRRAALRKPADTDYFKIGIAWQGRLTRKGDRFRSMPLKHFAALARVPNVQLYSLQVGPGAKQLETATFPVTDLGSRFDPNSLDDLAATLMNLDLVVTVDTAIAHLAGALGVHTWIGLHIAPCWRYLVDRSDNPWYPTFRLFRQKSLGDWDTVFDNIARELSKELQR
jgi:tetratricopeptide (TPR) repeat protein